MYLVCFLLSDTSSFGVVTFMHLFLNFLSFIHLIPFSSVLVCDSAVQMKVQFEKCGSEIWSNLQLKCTSDITDMLCLI